MNIDKHIVIKEVGTLTYSEISPIYKYNVIGKMNLDDKGYCHEDIIFNPSVDIKWKYSEISMFDDSTMIKKVELEYDFGMPHEFFPEQMIIERPDVWKYRGIDINSSILNIIKRYVETELIYALCRNPAELNTTHWALRGWLRTRTTLPWHDELLTYKTAL